MIQTMAYLLLIASLMGLAAYLGERICAELNWPRRSAWLAALVVSLALPAVAYLYGEASTAAIPFVSLPPLVAQLPAINGGVEIPAAGPAGTSALHWPDWQAFDAVLTGLWVASSVLLLLVFLLAAWRLGRITRAAQAFTIGGNSVLLSDRLGPAVLGFFRPHIVLPRWLATEDSSLRSQVLNHEREHIAARDQLTLLAALLIVAVMPWNIALWWQLRRLRTAVEVDCDRRVLRSGANAREYSQALLTVGQRAVPAPFAAVALIEPVSDLEKRIRIMLEKARGLSLAGCGARSVLIASAFGLAVAVNAPHAQQAAGEPGDAAAPRVVPALRVAIAERFEEAEACRQREDLQCAHRVLDEIAAIEDLNTYETGQLQNFLAFIAFEEDDMAAAIAAYEAIVALPLNELPDGLTSQAMRNLATLYLQADRLQDGLDAYDRWLSLPYVDASGSDYFLRATILYMLERYPAALAETERAIDSSAEPREHWYELLFALQSMIGDEAGMASTLAILDERWPDPDRAGAIDAAALGQSGLGGIGFGVSDGEYLPIVVVRPAYPPRAAARGLEGYVVVRYTVTTTGETKDIEVVDSSTTGLFDNAAIEAVSKYRYKPRIIDGLAVEVPGVTTRIEFDLPADD